MTAPGDAEQMERFGGHLATTFGPRHLLLTVASSQGDVNEEQEREQTARWSLCAFWVTLEDAMGMSRHAIVVACRSIPSGSWL